jgi:hypothetical protein
MESEYIALSQAMHTLLPLRTILDEVSNALSLKSHPKTSIHSRIYEDNPACLLLATSDPPKLTPRSKNIAVKYHWFQEHLVPGEVEIKPIGSDNQLADIFTKPLAAKLFEHFRSKLLGW